MKKKFFYASLLFLATIAACGDSDTDEEDDVTPLVTGDYENMNEEASEGSYLGSLTVSYQGEDYITENVKVSYTLNDEETLSLVLYNVKFVPQMPLTLTEVVVPNIPYSKEDASSITFSAESIVPTINDNEFPSYTASAIAGTINLEENTITFSLSFGSYPTSYTGSGIAQE